MKLYFPSKPMILTKTLSFIIQTQRYLIQPNHIHDLRHHPTHLQTSPYHQHHPLTTHLLNHPPNHQFKTIPDPLIHHTIHSRQYNLFHLNHSDHKDRKHYLLNSQTIIATTQTILGIRSLITYPIIISPHLIELSQLT